MEESKEEYYSMLAECSQGWHEGKNEIVPWWNYFLSMLRHAYKEFEQQVESTKARPAKSDLVKQTVLAQLEQFTLGPCGPVAVGQFLGAPPDPLGEASLRQGLHPPGVRLRRNSL